MYCIVSFSVGLVVPIVALQWFSFVEVSVGSWGTVMVPFSMGLEMHIVLLQWFSLVETVFPVDALLWFRLVWV